MSPISNTLRFVLASLLLTLIAGACDPHGNSVDTSLAPETPQNLAAVAGATTISLTWTMSSNATAYRVKRSLITGGPYTNVASPTSTTYTDTGLMNGTTYYYVVSATNTSGESANSAEVFATPTEETTVPSAPNGLGATSGDTTITLNWTGSTGAVAYHVKRSTTTGGPYTEIATPISVTYLDRGLTNGTTYYYVVSASNAAGESDNSNEASATPTFPFNNADLSGLMLSSGSLSPVFNSATTSYSASVIYAVTSTTVIPTAVDSRATITVQGTSVASGTASAPIALELGPNTITLEVTAPDGTTTKEYVVTVTRALGNNANLAALTVSAGTLSPTFHVGTTAYTVSVPYRVSTITVSATSADPLATVDYSPTQPASLSVGVNTITVTVAAQDLSTKNYILTVTRNTANNNADLSALTLSAGTLNPAFTAATTIYTVSVDNGVSSITVTGTKADPYATVAYTPSQPTSLSVGANNITVTVTAENGSTTKDYTITVTRSAVAVMRIINHSNFDPDSLPDDDFTDAKALRVFFEHASVGDNVLDGMATLAAVDSRYTIGRQTFVATDPYWPSDEDATSDAAAAATWFESHTGVWDFRRGNPNANRKTAIFQLSITDALAASVDVAMFKFCYIDAPDPSDWNNGFTATALFNTVKAAIEDLEATYPSVTFVWWTMPMETVSYSGRLSYNTLVRNYCTTNSKWLLDLADIEVFDDTGSACVDGSSNPTLCSVYTTDGGHLPKDPYSSPVKDSPGSRKVAKAVWRLLAEIARTK